MQAYALRQLDAAEAVEDPHDLFLVDHHAVGLVEDLLHDRVRVRRLLAAVLAVDVVVDHAAVERAGAVQGEQAIRSRMLSGFIRFSSSRMPSRFELEHALGVAALEQLVGLRVVERQLEQVDVDAARLLDRA